MTVKSTLRSINLLPAMIADYQDGEYRASVRKSAIRARHPELNDEQVAVRNEVIAYYSTDAEDALQTAAVISAQFALHGALPAAEPKPVRRDNVEYHAGVAAHGAGAAFDACPYLAGGDRAARWALGWNEADDARRHAAGPGDSWGSDSHTSAAIRSN